MNELHELGDKLSQLKTEANCQSEKLDGGSKRRKSRRKRTKRTGKSCDDPDDSLQVGTSENESTIQSLFLKPRGFQNYKNCCFLNVCLQTLLHIPEFVRVFRELDVSHPVLKPDSLCQLTSNLLNQFLPYTGSMSVLSLGVKFEGTHDSKVQNNTNGFQRSLISHFELGPSIVPDEKFFHVLGFDKGIQEDVAECLTRMLSRFHEELGAMGQNDRNSPASPSEDDLAGWIVTDRSGKRRPEARNTALQGGHSRIAELFSGILIARSTVKHVRAASQRSSLNVSVDQLTRQATCAATKEPFFILPLEINDPKITGIDTSLVRLTEVESVSDYHDHSTGLASNVNRRLGLDRLPPFLLLQLKRFTYSMGSAHPPSASSTHAPRSGSCTVDKSLKLINVPPELIIPAKLLNHEKVFTMDERRYRIRAVIFHLGETAASGHYTVAIRWEHESSTDSPSFLYLDDTRACVLRSPESVRLLLSTHRPLDANACSFHVLTKNGPRDITKQPRTPYVLVYESTALPPNS